jgi:progressive ankylosis protein
MQQNLTVGRVLRFYLPLAFNSILMMIEMPVVTAGISRLPDAEVQLAAYGVLFSLAYIFITMGVALTHTGNALGRSRQAFYLLRKFSLGVCLAITLLAGAVYFTPLYGLVVEGLLGAPAHVAVAAQPGLQLMLLVGLVVAWRRFYHGVLIRQGYTNLIGLITMVRVATLFAVVYAGVTVGTYTGMQVAGAALFASAGIEAVFVTIIAEVIFHRSTKIRWEKDKDFVISWGTALRFFLPLSLMLLLTAVMRPVIAAAMTRMPDPVLSLAAFPVAYGVFHLVYSPLWVLPQVVIALVKDEQSYRVVSRFVKLAGVVAAALLLGSSFTPLVDLYMANVLGVPADVRAFALPALRVISGYVLITAWQANYQGVLIRARRTGATQMATTVNMVTLCVALGIALVVGGLPGVVLGTIAFTVGYLAETLTLRHQALPLIARIYAPKPDKVATPEELAKRQ